jgi:hypothetical protein
MKIDWISVKEYRGNFIGQVINSGDSQISEVFIANGPIHDCGNPMLLTKCKYRDIESNEVEESDITSICEECNVEDVGYFSNESLEEYIDTDTKLRDDMRLEACQTSQIVKIERIGMDFSASFYKNIRSQDSTDIWFGVMTQEDFAKEMLFIGQHLNEKKQDD